MKVEINCFFCNVSFLLPKWRLKKAKHHFCSLRCNAFYNNSNERNGRWKGDKVKYAALHQWLRRQFGTPDKCVNCGKIGTGRFIQWANISGEYKRDFTDWKRLCPSCHKRFDLKKRMATSLGAEILTKHFEFGR